MVFFLPALTSSTVSGLTFSIVVRPGLSRDYVSGYICSARRHDDQPKMWKGVGTAAGVKGGTLATREDPTCSSNCRIASHAGFGMDTLLGFSEIVVALAL